MTARYPSLFHLERCPWTLRWTFQLINFPRTARLIISSGTKYIDPDSGLIYFKYDFGYEFGIIFPGEGRKFVAGGNNVNTNRSAQLSRNQFIHNSAGAIDIPVRHEKSIRSNASARGSSAQFLQSHKRTAPVDSHLYRPQSRPSIAINVDEFHTNRPIPSRTSAERGTKNNRRTWN